MKALFWNYWVFHGTQSIVNLFSTVELQGDNRTPFKFHSGSSPSMSCFDLLRLWYCGFMNLERTWNLEAQQGFIICFATIRFVHQEFNFLNTSHFPSVFHRGFVGAWSRPNISSYCPARVEKGSLRFASELSTTSQSALYQLLFRIDFSIYSDSIS